MARQIIADTSGIIALLDRDDKHHHAAVEVIKDRDIYIPVTILPEVDYLATKYLGERVSRAFLENIDRDQLTLLSFESDDLVKATKIMARYRDLPLGLVDASLLVLAEHYSINQILTLDRRHFNLIQSDKLIYFDILP